MIKVIYIYWSQKFKNAPEVVKKCLLSWKIKNSTWKIIELDDDNLEKYIDIKKEIPNFKKKKIRKEAYSDIVRILLLEKYGGCWCDATLFCNQPLDSWLDKYILNGFFAFEKPGEDRLISSWFLYSEKNNYIIKKWKEKTINFWKNNQMSKEYFWFHYLFNNLYKMDNKFKKIWDLTSKISADGPHYIQKQGLLNKLSNDVKNQIDKVEIPLYKLSYKYDLNNYNSDCNLSYLLNTKMFTFVHIGKTGGSTIKKNLNQKSINFKHEHCCEIKYKPNKFYIISIRNPISRFISAFNWRYYLLRTKIQKNDYELKIYEKYKNVNYLAENLYINNELNIELDKDINKIYKKHPSHLGMDINFYIGKLLEKCSKKQILTVLKTETLNYDFNNFFNLEIKEILKKNSNSSENISHLAYKNLKKYLKKDYDCIQKLIDFNLVDDNYLIDTDAQYTNYKFIHIGKCAGTTIRNIINFDSYHLSRNYQQNENFIVWIRNPISRFVSSFYYSKNIVNTDISKFIGNNLNLDNSLAPLKIKKKINTGYAYSKLYDNLVNEFKTANDLAESLTDTDIQRKNMALQLMNSPTEHIYKGLGWYLNNGEFIEKNYKKIVFVGVFENMSTDLKKLGVLLNKNIDFPKKFRENLNNNDKYLSSKAVNNIINFYKETDYKALQKLLEYNFITKKLFEEYYHYKI